MILAELKPGDTFVFDGDRITHTRVSGSKDDGYGGELHPYIDEDFNLFWDEGNAAVIRKHSR